MFAFLGTLVFMYSVSFLIHHFFGFMKFADEDTKDVQAVEVVNFGDFGRK